ncbi:MAG: AAA family ATPase [Myxococcota bacterium]
MVDSLHLLTFMDGGQAVRPTVLGLLYLPEASADLEVLDRLVRFAAESYTPEGNPVSVPSGLFVEPAEAQRLHDYAKDLYLHFPGDDCSTLRPSEWNWRHPTLEAAVLENFAYAYRNKDQTERLAGTRRLPFEFRVAALRVRNFRVLRSLDLELAPLTVLVGPNSVGKSTVLDAVAFIATAAELSLRDAITSEGGFGRLRTRGSDGALELGCDFNASYPNQRSLSGRYEMRVGPLGTDFVVDREALTVGEAAQEQTLVETRRGLASLSGADGAIERRYLSADTLAIPMARRNPDQFPLAADLGAALSRVVLLDRDSIVLGRDDSAFYLRRARSQRTRRALRIDQVFEPIANDPQRIKTMGEVLAELVPNVSEIVRVVVTGGTPEIEIRERGVAEPLRVDEISAGTRQMLLLAALYVHETPPAVLLLEEPDGGVHPGALSALVDLLRSLSAKMTVIVTTHSPALVARLDAEKEVRALDRTDEGVRVRTLAEALRSSGWLQAFGSTAEAFERRASERLP